MGKRVNTAVWYDKESRWKINVQKDGCRRTFTSGTSGRTGQREANAKADAWLDENITDTSKKVKKVFEEYLQQKELTTGTGNYNQTKHYVDVWIVPVIGNLKMSALNEGHLQSVIDNMYHKGKISRKEYPEKITYTGEKHSAKTLQGLRTVLINFSKFCRMNKYTSLFPENLSIPKAAVKLQKEILRPSDLAVLFSSDKTKLYQKETFDDLINAYRLQVLTGLRPGELIGLEWSDINGNLLTVKRSINKYGEITNGKNSNALRSFTLTETAMQVIAAQRQLSGTEQVFDGVTQNNLRLRWKKYCKHNSITVLTPYELRHTFVSIAKELPEGFLKPLVGHSQSMDTFGWYGHEAEGEKDKIANNLEQIFIKIIKPAN